MKGRHTKKVAGQTGPVGSDEITPRGTDRGDNFALPPLLEARFSAEAVALETSA